MRINEGRGDKGREGLHAFTWSLYICIIRDWAGMEFVAMGIPHEMDKCLYDKVGVVS